MFLRMLLAGGVAGAATTGAMVEPKDAPVEPPAVGGSILVEIVGRDSTITVRASDQGPRYAVGAGDLTPSVPGLTLGELDVQNPALSDHLREMWAGM
ncbi:MAG: hypothetical protein GY715_13475 [Planctomycetes bacterium]|nr:hypothetical protein [Planctomycetota bacterium]